MKCKKTKKVIMGFILMCTLFVGMTLTGKCEEADPAAISSITVAGKTYQVLDIPENMQEREGYEVEEIQIQDSIIPVWKYTDEHLKDYCQIYLQNEMGVKSVYQYEVSEGSLQRVYEDIEMINKLQEEELLWDQLELYYAIAVFALLIIVTLKIGASTGQQRRMSAKRAEYFAEKIEASYGAYEMKAEETVVKPESETEDQKLKEQRIASVQNTMYMPTLLSAKYENHMIRVCWKESERVQGYFVYRKTAQTKWKCIAKCYDCQQNFWEDKELCGQETYFYTVRAVVIVDEEPVLSNYDKKGVSALAAAGHVPRTPRLLTVSKEANGITLTWQLIPESDYYSIYRKEKDCNWKKIAETDYRSETSYIDTEVVGQTSYEYTVRASRILNKKMYTSEYENPGLKITF